jgi:hypothetical protein
MPLRPAMLRNVGGTLAIDATEGSPSAATVEIFNAVGVSVDTPVVTRAAAHLTCTVTAGVCAAIGADLRALWTYTVGTSIYRKNQLFDVVVALIYPTLTTAAQLAKLYPVLEGRDFLGVAKQDDLIAAAWADMLDEIRTMGREPNFLIDGAPLTAAHAAFAAASVARNFRPGAASSDDWQAWAAAAEEKGHKLLTAGMGNWRWYDANENLVPEDEEKNVTGMPILSM